MKIPDFLAQWMTKYWRLFALGVAVIIFSLGYVTLLAGKISQVRTEGLAERTQTVEQLKADEAYRAALEASSTAFDQKITTADRANLEQFIPTGSDFPTLLLTVQDIVARSNLQLTDLFVTEIGQTTAAGTTATQFTSGSDSQVTSGSDSSAAQAATVEGVNLRTQDIAVTVTGIRSYDDVKNLASVIESSRRLFDVVSLGFDLANSSGSESTGGVAGSPMTLRLRTYYLPATQ